MTYLKNTYFYSKYLNFRKFDTKGNKKSGKTIISITGHLKEEHVLITFEIK
jgi:hypothetical protein